MTVKGPGIELLRSQLEQSMLGKWGERLWSCLEAPDFFKRLIGDRDITEHGTVHRFSTLLGPDLQVNARWRSAAYLECPSASGQESLLSSVLCPAGPPKAFISYSSISVLLTELSCLT